MDHLIAVNHNNDDTLTLPMRDGALQKDPKTTFINLPEDILRRICEYLLSAREVNRGYVEYGLLRTRPEILYDFQTAIMRTNRALYKIARSVFAANHVIHVASSDYNIFTSIFGSEFSGPILQPPKLWTNNIEHATDIRMEVYFDTKDYRQPHYRPGDHAAGLLILENLADLVARMAMSDIAFHSQIGLSIYVKENRTGQSQPLKLQRALLEPFKSLHGIGQTCTIRGLVEPLLATQMEKCLTPEVHWYRTTKWLVYQSASSQAKLGYDAYSDGEFGHAFAFYRTAAVFTRNVRSHPIVFNEDDDLPLLRSYHELCATINHNAMTSGLLSCLSLDKDAREDVLQWVIQSRSDATDAPIALQYLFEGIAALGLNLAERVKAVRFAACDYLDIEEALKIMRTWCKQSPKKRTLTAYKYLKQLMKFVPKVPTKSPISIPSAPFTSVSNDYERYVLRALDYEGDLYEDRILQEEGNFFDKDQADRDVEWYRRKMAAQKAAGGVPEVWISSKIGKPGQGKH